MDNHLGQVLRNHRVNLNFVTKYFVDIFLKLYVLVLEVKIAEYVFSLREV